MRHYCTIFDKNYLFQGVTVYRSLKYSSQDYKFLPLCMDTESYDLLMKMDLENVIPIKVDDIITAELAEVRSRTTKGQFCWVCQPIICQYILDKFNAEIVIYLEADSMFFSDPEILLDELGDQSVSLVAHNYTPKQDFTETSGIYCVQFNAFKNTKQSRGILDYWKENCFKYSALQPGYFPGQLCLDNWPLLFEGVKSLLNPGAGVAPWNIGRFKVSIKNDQLCVDNSPVVFYHYHNYGRYQDGTYELGSYTFPENTVQLIYKEYVNELRISEALVHQTDPEFKFERLFQKNGSIANMKLLLNNYVNIIKRIIKKRYNVFPANYFDNTYNLESCLLKKQLKK